MKNLIFTSILMASQALMANPSVKDIQAILKDKKVQNVIQNAEISSIQNLGQRRYALTFDRCSLQVQLLSNCQPIPGGKCFLEVLFHSGDVNCLP